MLKKKICLERGPPEFHLLVHIIAAEARDFTAVVQDLGAAASWFRVLSRNTPNSDDGETAAPDQDEGETEDQADLGRDMFLEIQGRKVRKMTIVRVPSLTAFFAIEGTEWGAEVGDSRERDGSRECIPQNFQRNLQRVEGTLCSLGLRIIDNEGVRSM